MTSPLPYLDDEHLEHGTRGKYVGGCRCDECRAANLAAYHDREARSHQAVAELQKAPGSICPGWDGVPCPGLRKLRSDSAGVCSDCRKRAVWNGMVDAELARDHIRELGRKGVGYRTVADASKVNATTVRLVMTGVRTQVRKSTLDAILSVDEGAAADHALVNAGETRRMLRELEPEFLGKRKLAEALGYRSYFMPGNYAQKVLAKNAHRVRKLYRRVHEG